MTRRGSGLASSVVPLLLERDRGSKGVLLGHLARPNDQLTTSDLGAEALAIFAGPDAYVSPSLYPSKAVDGRVVPTWNYVVVHVTGNVVIHDDPQWTLDLVRRLTERHEARRPESWNVGDAPAGYIERKVRAVVGDEPFLWRMLREAVHAGDEVDGVEALKRMPELARYVDGWGRPGDLGVIATWHGEPVGAAWLRLLVGDDAGYGHVDDSTPELAIAVDPARTGQGIGGALLERLVLDAEPGFAAVSLSVRADNPARRLYERFGFRPVDGSAQENRVGGTSITMVRRFAAG